jgi:hypothetical protein
MANYWEEYANQNKWLVISSDMDGLTGYQVVHSQDARDVRLGSYWGGVVKHLTLNKAEAQAFADRLNAQGEPAPNNPFRNAFH